MEFTEILTPLITFAVTLGAALALRKFIFKAFAKWTTASEVKLNDIAAGSLKAPSYLWCVLLAVFYALKISNIPQDLVDLFSRLLMVLSVGSVTFVIASISGKLIKLYSGKRESALALTSLSRNVARIAIFSCGGLIILSNLGISITPILTALGVGGLAIALALQDTLSNLFSGLQITVARQIRVGDYIKIDSGQEGYVEDINWRSTKIRTLANNMVIVPNAKLTQAIVTNYYLPDRELAVSLELGVHYDSDLDKVERVTAEVAAEVMKEVSSAAVSFEPLIRYDRLGDYSVNFTVILKAKEFTGQHLIKHEFIKRLHKRYRKEGIVIPYPVRAINYAQEKSGA